MAGVRRTVTSKLGKEDRLRIRAHNKRVKIHDDLARALEAYIASQSGQTATANNVTMVVTCTHLKCLLKEI